MLLKTLQLQHFRSYPSKTVTFSPDTTVIVGPNTAGKTNTIEAIYLLTTGKSFRAEKDTEMISYGQDIGRVKAVVDDVQLEVLLATGQYAKGSMMKRFLVNGVAKRRTEFCDHLQSILFSPVDLEIVLEAPGTRRRFLDDVLEQVSTEYRVALAEYTKGIRRRNALLSLVQETGRKDKGQFVYWDELVIRYGSILTRYRETFIDYINTSQKDVFDLVVTYDNSVISEERLAKYEQAEIASGVTLVGPHRDNFFVYMNGQDGEKTAEVRLYGSRGQQRLAVLQLKLLQLSYIENALGRRPLLLLDDIFSELDDGHIRLVSDMVKLQQTIVTTTHKEFAAHGFPDGASVIELSKAKQ